MITKIYDNQGDKTVLLLHGFGSNVQHAWKDTISFLKKHNLNIVAFELTGHGESNRLEKYSLENWVEEIATKLTTTYTLPDYVIAHSMGGLITVGLSNNIEFKKILLIDPFLYMRSHFTNFVTRAFMKTYTTMSYKTAKKRNPSWDRKMILEEIKSLRIWDTNTLQALDRSGQTLVDSFIKNNVTETLILKPTKSLLIPKKFITTLKQNRNIIIEDIKDSGHSVHKDNTEKYLEKMEYFLFR